MTAAHLQMGKCYTTNPNAQSFATIYGYKLGQWWLDECSVEHGYHATFDFDSDILTSFIN